MLEIIEALSDYYIIFTIIAVFAILALIGYLYETKHGVSIDESKKFFASAVNTNVEALKNSVANKTLNTAVTDNNKNNGLSKSDSVDKL